MLERLTTLKKQVYSIKDYEEKLTAKEILQAFVSTLSEKNCKEAYRLLRERYDKSKVRMLTLNREGVPVPDGMIGISIIGGITPFCALKEIGEEIDIKIIG